MSLFLATGAAAAPAQPPAMVYAYIGPESPEDHRYDYHWLVLREALEKTVPRYGPFAMESASFMDEDRQAFELQNQGGKITVLIRGDTLEYAQKFTAVWIPIDKGLLGYRVFLIRHADQPRFTSATTLDDLRNYTIGQGTGWKDIDILRLNGLQVVAGGDYAGLFPMLANERFDLFSRGVEEVSDEYLQHQKQFPTLAIEQHLLLYYPIARYFWFAKSDAGQRLAARVREGMTMMVEDGSLDRLFATSHAKLFAGLHLATRKLLVLKNPFAASAAPLGDPRLWYSPLSGAVSAPAPDLPSVKSP